MSLYYRSINPAISFYMLWWCQTAIMSVLTSANYEHNGENTTRDFNISSYNKKHTGDIIIESGDPQTETVFRDSYVWNNSNSSAIQNEHMDYKDSSTDLKQTTDNSIILTELPLQILKKDVTNSTLQQSNNQSGSVEYIANELNISKIGHSDKTQNEEKTSKGTVSYGDKGIISNTPAEDRILNSTVNFTANQSVTNLPSNITTREKGNLTAKDDVLYVKNTIVSQGHPRIGDVGLKQLQIRRHHLQIVPMEDEPFGAVLWKDERYMVSIIIPIGVGITGAAVIMITLYTLRYIARKNARGFHFPDLEHASAASCISSISSERTDRVVLLGGDEDDEF